MLTKSIVMSVLLIMPVAFAAGPAAAKSWQDERGIQNPRPTPPHIRDAGTCKSVTCRPDLSAFSESVKPLTEQYRVNRMLAPGAR